MEIYSGICPVCNQEFNTTAEIIDGYYVFNCNNCNTKLRVKKETPKEPEKDIQPKPIQEPIVVPTKVETKKKSSFVKTIERKEKTKKRMVALIGMILTLIFIMVALFGPWYGNSVTYISTGTEHHQEYITSLTSVTYKQDGSTTTSSLADLRKTTEELGGSTVMYDIYNIALYLTIFALIFTILTLVFLLGYTFNFGKPSMTRSIATILCVITFIMALLAVFYFMFKITYVTNNLIPEVNIGFWYSMSTSTGSLSVGPGFGWYLMLVAGITSLISSIFIFINKPKATIEQSQIPQVVS